MHNTPTRDVLEARVIAFVHVVYPKRKKTWLCEEATEYSILCSQHWHAHRPVPVPARLHRGRALQPLKRVEPSAHARRDTRAKDRRDGVRGGPFLIAEPLSSGVPKRTNSLSLMMPPSFIMRSTILPRLSPLTLAAAGSRR